MLYNFVWGKFDSLFTGISVLIVQPVTVATLKNEKFKNFGTEEEIEHLKTKTSRGQRPHQHGPFKKWAGPKK